MEGFYAVSAAVALGRHHKSPRTVDVQVGQAVEPYDAEWRAPTEDEKRGCANEADTTCFGAYALALAAVFAHLGLKAVGRAAGGTGRKGEGTGADWLLLPADVEVPEWYMEHPDIRRLEVSGQDEATPGERNSRMKIKLNQTQQGTLRHIPATAAVVEFSLPIVTLAQAS
jgi:hypothetical protein